MSTSTSPEFYGTDLYIKLFAAKSDDIITDV